MAGKKREIGSKPLHVDQFGMITQSQYARVWCNAAVIDSKRIKTSYL